MKFGECLVQWGYVKESQRDEALEIQCRHKRKKLGRILFELGYLDKKTLNLALTRFFDSRRPMNLNDCSSLEMAHKIREASKSSPKLRRLAKEYKALLYRDEIEDGANVEYLRGETIDDDLLASTEELTQKEAYCWTISREEFELLNSLDVPSQAGGRRAEGKN